MKNNRAKAAHLRLGRRGENAAANLLRSKGFEILCRNWKHGPGELDIVARDGAMLVFAEVKSRRRFSPRRPLSNLSTGQRRRIRFGASKYLAELGPDCRIAFRFDLIEVWLTPWRVAAIRHFENCLRRDAPGYRYSR